LTPASAGPSPSADIRALRPEDDLEAQLDLARRAFGQSDEATRARRLAAVEAAVSGGRYYAACRVAP
jgi:hypothetical protein